MTLKPQINVGIINNIFSYEGRKIEDLFVLKELDVAIAALERNNPIEGAAARADYYSYREQPEYALDLMKRATKKYGYNSFFARSEMRASEFVGDWSLIKEVYERALMCKSFELETETLERYIEISEMHIDNSGNFMDILNKYKIVGREQLHYKIDVLAQQILLKGCTLEAYRKTLGIAFKTIYEKYSMPLTVAIRIENLQCIISSDNWTDQDTEDVTESINDAIMAEEDIDFLIAADEIEVFCINFPINKVPENFSYYGDDDDDDLVELVKSRMEENISPEIDWEELHV